MYVYKISSFRCTRSKNKFSKVIDKSSILRIVESFYEFLISNEFMFSISLLVAVVIAFFLCWAPFHCQRLLAIYGEENNDDDTIAHVYYILTYISGICYYLSTCINPLLYNIMSHKFRTAFKVSKYPFLHTIDLLHCFYDFSCLFDLIMPYYYINILFIFPSH